MFGGPYPEDHPLLTAAKSDCLEPAFADSGFKFGKSLPLHKDSLRGFPRMDCRHATSGYIGELYIQSVSTG